MNRKFPEKKEKKKELETLIHAVRIYSQGIGMEFGIEKWAILVMKRGKRHLTDGMELPNQNKIRTLAEKETYKYLGILEADTIKHVEMKNKIQKEYLRRTGKRQQTKLLPALKTALTHRYNDSNTIYKNMMEDSLQPSETIMITRWTTE